MRQRLVGILILALLVAGAASLMVYRIIQAQSAKGPAVTVTKVVMAAHDIEVGTLLKEIDLKTGDWAGPLPRGSVVDAKTLIGRGVVVAMYEGEPVLETRLAAAGAGGGLAAIIPPGMRACAVRVNEVVGVSGFALPGMRVDVLVAGTPPGAATNTGPRVRTLLQNIEVLSAGSNLQKDAEGKPVQVQVVNLLVTPEQAELLSLASNETRIQLVLRNPLDREQTQTHGSAMSAILGEPPPAPRPTGSASRVIRPAVKPAAPPPAPKPYLVEVLVGPAKSEVKFPGQEAKQ